MSSIRAGAALLQILIVWLVAAPALARPTLQGSSSTFLRGFVVPADEQAPTYVPFYELVELHARRLGVDGLSIHTSLWGLIDMVDIQDRYRVSGDVSTLYVEYRAPEVTRLKLLRGLQLNAGRQFVALGPTILEQLDGGKVHYHHASGLEVGVFGGAPTGTRVAFQPWPADEDRYNYGMSWLVGGRLGYLNLGQLAGGVSVVHRRFRDQIADSDLGADLSYAPHRMIDLAASSTLSIEALRAKEIKASVGLRFIEPLTVDLRYRYSSPDLFVPRTSIFAVFSEETYHEAALQARWRTRRDLNLDAEYARRFYSAASDGRASVEGANRVLLRALIRRPGWRATSELERIEAPENAATRLRLAGALPFVLLRRELSLIVDLDLMILDETIRDSRVSFTGGGYLEVPLRPSLRLLAGGSGAATPLLRRAGSFLLRLVWDLQLPSSDDPVQVQRGRLQ